MSAVLQSPTPLKNPKWKRRKAGVIPLGGIRGADKTWRHNGSVACRSIDYLWPWSRQSYPGLYIGVRLTLGRWVSWGGIRHWIVEKRRLPLWAALQLREAIYARVAVGTVLVSELDAYISSRESELRHQYGKLNGRVTDD